MQVPIRLSEYNDNYYPDTLKIRGTLAVLHRFRLWSPPASLILIHNSLNYLGTRVDVAAADPRNRITAHRIDKKLIANSSGIGNTTVCNTNNVNGKLRDNGLLLVVKPTTAPR